MSWCFAQITDSHYGYNSEGDDATHDAITFINSKIADYNIQFTIITGDLFDNDGATPPATNAANLKTYLEANLNTPYYTVMGNHDNDATDTDPALYLQYFGDKQTDSTLTYYSFVKQGLRVIAIGQNEFRDTVSDTELAFLSTELTAAKTNNQTPVTVFHEPLDADNSIHEVNNPQDVIAVLQSENGRMFICGHTHDWDYRMVGGSINQIQGAAVGRRWGDPDELSAVILYVVSGSEIQVQHWECWNPAPTYNPTLRHIFTVDLAEPEPPEPGDLTPTPDFIVPDNGGFQEVIDNAPDGSIIFARAGTYGGISLRGHSNLLIYGQMPAYPGSPSRYRYGPPFFPDSPTVIQGPTPSDQYGLIDARDGTGNTLRFLTLRDGTQSSSAWYSGTGIYHSDDFNGTWNLTIEYVNIYNCWAAGINYIAWAGNRTIPQDCNTKIWGCKIVDSPNGGAPYRGSCIQISRGTTEQGYCLTESSIRDSWCQGNLGGGDYGATGAYPLWNWTHHCVSTGHDGVGYESHCRDNVIEYTVSHYNGRVVGGNTGYPGTREYHVATGFLGGGDYNPSGLHHKFRYNTMIAAGHDGAQWYGTGGEVAWNVGGEMGWDTSSSWWLDTSRNATADVHDNHYYLDEYGDPGDDVRTIMLNLADAYPWCTFWLPTDQMQPDDYFRGNYVFKKFVSEETAVTYNVDTLLQKLGVTATVAADAVFQKELTQTFTADCVIGGPITTRVYAADSLFQKLNVPTSYMTDAAFSKQQSKTFTADVAFKKPSAPKTYTADSLFKRTTLEQAYYVSTTFGATGTYARNISADTVFSKADVIKNYGVDTVFYKEFVAPTPSAHADFFSRFEKIPMPEVRLLDQDQAILDEMEWRLDVKTGDYKRTMKRFERLPSQSGAEAWKRLMARFRKLRK